MSQKGNPVQFITPAPLKADFRCRYLGISEAQVLVWQEWNTEDILIRIANYRATC